MKNRKFWVSRVLAVGVLGVGAFAAPVMEAPLAAVAAADVCGGGGGFVPFYAGGGGGGCDQITLGGNHVQCGQGDGFAGQIAGGGGGCHVFGGEAGDFFCDVSVHVHVFVAVDVDHVNPCPYVR
jgi:hypothetical protein